MASCHTCEAMKQVLITSSLVLQEEDKEDVQVEVILWRKQINIKTMDISIHANPYS